MIEYFNNNEQIKIKSEHQLNRYLKFVLSYKNHTKVKYTRQNTIIFCQKSILMNLENLIGI